MRTVGKVYPSEDSAMWGEILGDIKDQKDLVSLVGEQKLYTDSKVNQVKKDVQGISDTFEDELNNEAKRARKAEEALANKIEAAGASIWGQIKGDVFDQADLQDALKSAHGLTVEGVRGDHYHFADERGKEYDFEYEEFDEELGDYREYKLHQIGNVAFYKDVVEEGTNYHDIVADRLQQDIELGKPYAKALLENYMEAKEKTSLKVMQRTFPQEYSPGINTDTALCQTYVAEPEYI